MGGRKAPCGTFLEGNVRRIRITTDTPIHVGGAFKQRGDEVVVKDAQAAQLVHDGNAEFIDREMVRAPADRMMRRKDMPTPDPFPDAPALWVVIPTRNRAKDLGLTLDAVLAQEPDGIVLVDDASDKGCCWEPARTLHIGDAFHMLRLPEHRGVNYARRVGTSVVPRDAVVVELDDHDLPCDGALDALREAFRDPDIHAVYGDAEFIDRDGKLLKERLDKRDYEPFTLRQHGSQILGLRAYRKKIYDEVGGWRLDEWPAGDYALFLRIEDKLQGRGIVRIPKPICRVRRGVVGSISVRHLSGQDSNADRFRSMALNGLLWQETEHRPKPEPDKEQDIEADKRPHVLLIAESVGNLGGGHVSMTGMMRQLHERGWATSALYASKTGTLPDWIEACSAQTKNFVKRAAEIRPDIALVTGALVAQIGPQLQAAGIPVLCAIQFWRGLFPLTESTWEDLGEGRAPVERDPGADAIVAADAVVANGDFSATIFYQATGREADAVVYPPLDPETFLCKRGRAVHKRRFVTCTSTEHGKGVNIFLDLAAAHPKIEFLLLTGDGRHPGTAQVRVRALAMDNVTVRDGWIADMRTVYKDTRCVFIGTQTAESWCRVAAEARANGIPMLVARAGNLVNMAAGGHGVVVDRKAPLADWRDGLRRALELRPKRDKKLLRDCGDDLDRVARDARRMSDVAFVYAGAPGVDAAVRYAGRVLGAEAYPVNTPMVDLGHHGLVVVSSQLTPQMDAHEGPLAVWWHSHCSQMDYERDEMGRLVRIVEAFKDKPNRYLCFTSKGEAELWRKVLGDRSVYLPVTMRWSETYKDGERSGVFIPGPYNVRKNVFVALAAVAATGRAVYFTNWAREVPGLGSMARAIGIEPHYHACATAHDVRTLAASCEAAVMVSASETFCYAAAECVIEGTPTVGWRGIPALAGGPKALLADDPTDIASVAKALTAALDKGPELAARQYEALAREVETRRRDARAALRGMMEGEK